MGSNKSIRPSFRLALLAGVTITFSLLAFYLPNQTKTQKLVGEHTSAQHAPIRDIELSTLSLDNIKAEIINHYPKASFKAAIEQQIENTQHSVKSADLVERITLNREIDLLNIKLHNATNSYNETVTILVDTFFLLERFKDNFDATNYSLAISGLIRGNTEIAEKLLSKIENKNRVALGGDAIDQAAEAVYMLGRISENDNKYRSAYQHFRRAVKYDPENPKFLISAGKLADNIALYSNAIIFFEAALHQLKNKPNQIEHDYPQLLTKLGQVWESKGNLNKAKDYFQEAASQYEQKLGASHPFTQSANKNINQIKNPTSVPEGN